MNLYATMPREQVNGWATRLVPHKAKERAPLHYHKEEEWLEVRRGEIRFYTPGGRAFQLVEGMALRIPQGEVHRVEMGHDDVQYRMWTPIEVDSDHFGHPLDPDLDALVKDNLKAPEVENDQDRAAYHKFFDRLLAKDFVFRTGLGTFVDRVNFLIRGPGSDHRESSGAIQILHRGPEKPEDGAESLLLSTVVHTRPIAGGARKSFVNLRLFVKEATDWKCRFWINYPEPAAP